jgi:restriction system protein
VAIPDFQSLMLPLLQLCGDGKEHASREAVESLAKSFNLSESERQELLPSGSQSRFANRVHWAKFNLKKAGLVTDVRWGHFQINPRGREVLNQQPAEITMSYLDQFPEYKDFRTRPGNRDLEPPEIPEEQGRTPEELMEAAYQKLRAEMEAQLLEKLKGCSPAFFERLVVQLLVRMGYGGTLQDAGRAVGRTGDGGIDGIIKEDRLGLDAIYIQAKRWEGTVGSPKVREFAGALQGQRAKKGIFITTSDYSKDALDYVSRIDSKIVLIDGTMLAGLMIDYGLGVSTVSTYEIKRVDSDFFAEE